MADFLLLQNLHFRHPWRSDAQERPWQQASKEMNGESRISKQFDLRWCSFPSLVAILRLKLRVLEEIANDYIGSTAAVQPQARFPHDYVCYTPVSGPLIIVAIQLDSPFARAFLLSCFMKLSSVGIGFWRDGLRAVNWRAKVNSLEGWLALKIEHPILVCFRFNPHCCCVQQISLAV